MTDLSLYSSQFKMRMFANWESDRSNSSTVQRVFLLSINRLTLNSISDDLANTLVITFKLRSGKRSLRTNDINIPLSQNDKITVDLDLSITIQYPHFLKKANTLLILIQRRKKYGKRKIPGFKNIAVGRLNLTDILQHGSLKEITLWLMNDYNKSENLNNEYLTPFGVLNVTNCSSQAAPSEFIEKSKNDELGTLSEEDDDQDSSQEDNNIRDDYIRNNLYHNIHSRRNKHSRQNPSTKKINQKNLKQKFVNLMKKLKNTDVDEPEKEGSIVMARTAQELEEWFEELENLSDSGPEFDNDRVSIISNPRPGLRPFFGSTSNVDIYPVLEKYQNNLSEESVETDEPETSSDHEIGNESYTESLFKRDSDIHKKESITKDNSNYNTNKQHIHALSLDMTDKINTEKILRSSTLHSLGDQKKCSTQNISQTFDSISFVHAQSCQPSTPNKKIESELSFTELLSKTLKLDDTSLVSLKNVWIICTQDMPSLKCLYNLSSEIKILDCFSLIDTKAAIHGIISKIQKFCNTNSCEPDETLIGVCGSDKHISNIVRAYIDSMQNKTSNNWTNYLRFVVISPSYSTVGRLLRPLNSDFSNLIENFWISLSCNKLTDVEELMSILLNLNNVLKTSHDSPNSSSGEGLCFKRLNLPLGEVMLQSSTNEQVSVSRQLFIPFILQVTVGDIDNILTLNKTNSMDNGDKLIPNNNTHCNVNNLSRNTYSPPHSPSSIKGDTKELQIDYWTVAPSAAREAQASSDNYAFDRNIQPRKDFFLNSEKTTLKTNFKYLCIYRDLLSQFLNFQFVKEKKKDNVLQKFARKKGGKNDLTSYQNFITSSITRLICHAKHSNFEVTIDGNVYTSIRFFQISSQWQTHVKFFPIALPTNNI
ncbi:AT03104p [Strongyloides ratti]|uniref:AT03104p n=1 Tax=Strongyloides ratti TaxID=34506 RepID=A0A090KZZ3_STRRB|nr:AT03104p [Strongyloides ratti]CEF62996.1 AT03104p [Strongyloides ratti]